MNVTSIRALLRFGAVLTFAAGLIGTAHADGGTDVPTQIVRFTDLNMASPQDVATLYRRINSAAQAVCPDPRSESGIRANQAKFCLRWAVEGAVRRINAPQLTALWQKNPRSAPALLADRTP
jgi:UrcA family protein